MLGDNIKKIRNEKGMTQKDLADKLFVTAQAVSRWENNEAEPSVSTITEIAKIFNVTITDLIVEEKPQEVATKEEAIEEVKAEEVEAKEPQEIIVVEEEPEIEEPKVVEIKQPKPVLAVCEHCNKPIYEANKIVRKTERIGETAVKKVLCSDCDEKIRIAQWNAAVEAGRKRRNKSFIWSGIFAGIILAITLSYNISTKQPLDIILYGVAGSLMFFTFFSCLYLKNNFIEDVFLGVSSWAVRFPGLIFTLDLDGIIWFITVKLIFAILSGLISILVFILALFLSLILSVFVYPFALVKNITRPQDVEI